MQQHNYSIKCSMREHSTGCRHGWLRKAGGALGRGHTTRPPLPRGSLRPGARPYAFLVPPNYFAGYADGPHAARVHLHRAPTLVAASQLSLACCALQVKNRFANKKEVYDTFLEIMKEFKAQRYGVCGGVLWGPGLQDLF